LTTVGEYLRRVGVSSVVASRGLLGGLMVLVVACAAGCGSSDAKSGTTRVAVAAVGSRMRQMLSDLEAGNYTATCEAFTLKSRYGMAIAPAFDGHESDSSCSDVFIMAGTMKNLGFGTFGHALVREAGKAGLTKVVDLPAREIHKLLRGIGTLVITPVVDNLEIKGNTARYRGTVVARYEDGHWLLEAAGGVKTTYTQDREDLERQCGVALTKQEMRLCHLLRDVLAGRVFSGAIHRELNHLLPLSFRQWKVVEHKLQRAFAHSH
jgi:hypothetical protein